MFEKLPKQIDRYIETIMGLYNFAGLTLGIVSDNEIVYARGFGVRDIKTNEPAQPDSLFSLASISKTFVATAIMQLVEQGKLTLDSPLTACLPYFHIADPRHKKITIGQMLSHVSGMPDIEDYTWDPPEFDDGALERYVRNMGKETLEFPPGEKFVYSNTAFDILGQVIAEVSGQSFEAYIDEHILQPLGMQNSTFLYKEVSPGLITSPFLCLPHLEAAPFYPYTRPHAPCGSLHSSAVDLCLWGLANLNKGNFQDAQILEPASYSLLWQPVALMEEKNPDEYVGLCWFLGKYKGLSTVGHSGSDIGFNTLLTLIPEKSIGVVVLANTYPAPTEVITHGILDLLLGYEPSIPKPLIIQTLSPILKTKGLNAAIEAYYAIIQAQSPEYDTSPGQFSDIGYMLTELRRQTEAMEVIKLGIEINPKDDRLYFELARATMQCGDKIQAAQYCRQCLENNPNYWEAAKLLNELQ